MASRRMFSQTITNSDRFLDMPHSTQLLYFHLGMQADDDGFLDNYNSIIRNVKCNIDDLKLLAAKGFLIVFDTDVVVIRDWRINNQLRKDRYRRTKYLQERKLLQVLDSGEYDLIDTGCQFGNQMATKSSIVESSIGKVSIGESPRACACEGAPSVKPPTLDEVKDYCKERNSKIDVERFYNYYASRGWLLSGDVSVRDWQALVKCWETREQPTEQTSQNWLDDLDDI